MKKRLWVTLVLFLLLLPCTAATVWADTAPKPSVQITFSGLEQESYYVTLLSSEPSTGPWNKNNDSKTWGGEKEIWDKFHSYSDADGFYFLGYFSDCTGTDTFAWTYYPPGTFKILLYFPKYDSFFISGSSYERYAFHSYYTVNAEDLSITSSGSKETIQAIPSYNYTWELVSLLCRIAATIIIEVLIAYLFGFCSKKQLFVIAAVNVITQTLLNILINLINYKRGCYAFVFHYIWLELAVFLVEGVIYKALLYRYEKKPGRSLHPWGYAFIANLASFVIGMLIAKWIPGIF